MATTIERKIDKILTILDGHSGVLNSHSQILASHSQILERHEELIKKNNQAIEDLAISVKNGFDAVYERLDQMVTKDVFNERMDRVEFRGNEYGRRLDNLEDKVGLISKKIGLSRK